MHGLISDVSQTRTEVILAFLLRAVQNKYISNNGK